MKGINVLLMLLFISSALTAQNTLWQNMNNNLYYLGNVGIGTPFPTERVQVDGNVSAKAYYTPNIVFGSQTPELSYLNAASTIGTYRASQSLYLQSPNDLFFHTGILEDSLASMTILRNGNVGIGTDTPITNFHVTGTTQFDGVTRLNYLYPNAIDSSAQRILYLGTPSEYFGGLMYNVSDTLYGDGDDFTIFADDEKDLVLHTDDDSKTIIPNGRLGVGTFSPSPEHILDINATSSYPHASVAISGINSAHSSSIRLFTARPEKDKSFYSATIGSGNKGWLMQAVGETQDRSDKGDFGIWYWGEENWKNYVNIKNESGNVGIGTFHPTAKLHVAGDIYSQIIRSGYLYPVNSNADGNYKHIRFGEPDEYYAGFMWNRNSTSYGDGNDFTIFTYENRDIVFRPSGSGNCIFHNGDVGIGTTNPNYDLHVNGRAGKPGGGWWETVSDKRLKKNIKNYEDGLEQIMQIRPVWYQYNGKLSLPTDEQYVGIIAQEMQKVAPYTVGTFQGEEKGEEYLDFDGSALTFMLVNAVQEQQTHIQEQQTHIQELEETNQNLENRLARLEQLVLQLTQQPSNISTRNTKLSSTELKQNQPNPFTETTSIQYFIPEEIQKAVLRITTPEGKVLKQLSISERGHGQIVLEASSLNADSYWYSLLLDGKVFETKKMILTK